jgi:hypothetical protein
VKVPTNFGEVVINIFEDVKAREILQKVSFLLLKKNQQNKKKSRGMSS